MKTKRKEKMEGTLAQQLTKLEMRMEGIEEEEGSDNRTIAKKTVKKKKRMLRKDCTSLSQMEEEMGMECIEPAVPKLFEEVKTDILERAQSSWKLEDSQKGWSQEGMKGTMEWEEKRGKEEIADSQMEEEGTIQTVNSKEDLEKWMKQGDSRTPKVNWRPWSGSLAKEMDSVMNEVIKTTEGLAENKHMVKERTKEEVDWMAREICLEKDKVEEEDNNM